MRFPQVRGARRRLLGWLAAPLFLGLLLAVSLEEVTEEPPPLDPRFYQGGGTTTVGPGPGLVPFADHAGPMVTLRGVSTAEVNGGLALDLWRVDPDAPGSRVHLGKLELDAIGPFEIAAPEGFGLLQVEAFMDQSGDGPTNDDPFGRIEVEVGDADVDGLTLALVIGDLDRLRGGPPPGSGSPPAGLEHMEMPPGGPDADPQPTGAAGAEHVEAGPGAPGGGEHEHVEAPPGAPGGGGTQRHDPDAVSAGAAPAPEGPGPDPFAKVEGPRVTISGTLRYRDEGALFDMDIFRSDPAGPGGRAFVGKRKIRPGAFSVAVPRSFGEVTLEVFLDATGDGPSQDDPYAACPCNPVSLGKGDIDGVEIVVE